MPYVAHKRLVTVIHMPYHTVYHGGSLIPIRVHAHVRPSVLAAEINRIRNLTRPSTQSYTEKYLQSRDYIYFDDEAREIRARVDSLLRRVHVFIPRAVASDFAEEIVPERMRSGDYVRRLISGKQNAKKYSLEPVSWYDVPDRGNFGNLACVKYVAGKPQSVRKPYFKVADLRPADIKNDVNLLSYYSKNREAAANASPDEPMTERELRKARALEPELDEATPRRAVRTEKETESKQENKRGGQRGRTETQETKDKVVEAPRMKESEAVQGTKPKGDSIAQERTESAFNVAGEPESLNEPGPVEESKSVKELKSVKKGKLTKAVESVKKSEPFKEQEPLVEPKQVEVVKAPEPVTDPIAAKEPTAIKEPEPVKEAELLSESVKSPEPELSVAEPTSIEVSRTVDETAQAVQESPLETVPEPAPTSETQPEFKKESIPEASEESRIAEVVSEPKETDEKEASDQDVRQDKEEAVKRIEQYLVKAAEEARSDEERKQAAEEEMVKLEMDELKAWEALQVAQERVAHLDDIIEQENVEARRKAEEAKIEAERLETEAILEQERKIAEARTIALLKEQERMIVEEELEKARELEEKEERLANVTFDDPDEIKDVDRSCDEVITCDITDQEKEERPYDPITDEDTRIDEENIQEEEQFEMAEDPFVEEPEGAESKPEAGANAVEGSSKIEDVTSGGEGTFQWGDEDA